MLVCCASASAWAQGTAGTVNVPETRIVASRYSKLKVTLQSSTPYRDLQFDLTLPEGITLKDAEKGGTVTDLASGHTIAYNAQEGGAIRFVVVDNIIESADQTATSADAATYGKSLSSGIIVEIPINAAATFAGTKQATLANMSTSKEDGERVDLTEGTFDIKINLLGDVNEDDDVDVQDIVVLIDKIQLGNPPVFNEGAADIDNDELWDVQDVTGIVSIIQGSSGNVKKMFYEKLLNEVDLMDPE